MVGFDTMLYEQSCRSPAIAQAPQHCSDLNHSWEMAFILYLQHSVEFICFIHHWNQYGIVNPYTQTIFKAGQPNPHPPGNIPSPEIRPAIKGLLTIGYWFPLIRPAIKASFLPENLLPTLLRPRP